MPLADRMKKILKRPSTYLLFVAATLGLLFAIWIQHPIRLIIENESTQNYKSVRVDVGRQNIDFGDLESGVRKERWFLYRGSDSSFRLYAMSKDEKIDHSAGYITSGPGLETVYFEFRENREIYFDHKH